MEHSLVVELAKKLTRIKPSPLNEQFRKLYEEMAVHTQECKPTEKLIKARPNEPEEIIAYRDENFESITYGSLRKAFDSLFRVFNSVGIEVQTGDEETDKYLKTDSFMNNTFMMFYIKIYLNRMIEDSNGWLVWLPGGIGASDNSVSTDPYPELLFSFDLIDSDSDYMVFLSQECSMIETKDGYERVGRIYYIITDTDFFTYTEATGSTFELKHVYNHAFNKIPVIPLGGDLNSKGLYQSFFRPFVALGNEAIRQFSDWQALSLTASFPIREEFQVNCEVQELKPNKKRRKGSADELQGINNLEEYKTHMVLKPMPKSMYGTIIRNGTSNDNSLGSSVLDPNVPSVRFISPGVEYVKNAFETFQSLVEMAESNLHLNLGDYALSGEAKKVDLLAFEDMLNKIFLQLIDSMKKSAQYIVAYKKRITPDKTSVKVIQPATFRVKSEVELMAELTSLRTANCPQMLIGAVAIDLAKLRFSGDEVNKKIFDIISTYDLLFTYSPSEKNSMFMANTAKKEDVINSQYIYPALLNLSKEMGQANFLDAKNDVLFNKFLEVVKPHYVADPILTNDLGQPQ